MFLVEVFQDPLERAIVNTLWQVGLSSLMVHHVPPPAGPADPTSTSGAATVASRHHPAASAPPHLAATEAPSVLPPPPPPPRGTGDDEALPPRAASHAPPPPGWTRRGPKAKVKLYDGAGLLPLLLGEVGADSWEAATRAVREARGQVGLTLTLTPTLTQP